MHFAAQHHPKVTLSPCRRFTLMCAWRVVKLRKFMLDSGAGPFQTPYGMGRSRSSAVHWMKGLWSQGYAPLFVGNFAPSSRP